MFESSTLVELEIDEILRDSAPMIMRMGPGYPRKAAFPRLKNLTLRFTNRTTDMIPAIENRGGFPGRAAQADADSSNTLAGRELQGPDHPELKTLYIISCTVNFGLLLQGFKSNKPAAVELTIPCTKCPSAKLLIRQLNEANIDTLGILWALKM
ncbi:hypothetical protein LPJ66_006812 [Kickxella alabastrina]|uniref:Uncharacterized protein n=1 Tax=Kickxella alabastrina TaxID=61397 RepID=A0ACC1IAV8_9FUNG|nr:hypothetical protein LPJ66_006812 [Kickxella alabastrina]